MEIKAISSYSIGIAPNEWDFLEHEFIMFRPNEPARDNWIFRKFHHEISFIYLFIYWF
jgi:hypothetical protein